MKKIHWTNEATEDLLDIIEFISDKNPKATNKLINEIENKSELINKFNELGQEIEFIKGIRQILINPIRILYLPTMESINIIACIHQSRDWQDLLNQRLNRN